MLSSREVSSEIKQSISADAIDQSSELARFNLDSRNWSFHKVPSNAIEIHQERQLYAVDATNFRIRLYDTGQLALSIKTNVQNDQPKTQNEFESAEISDSNNTDYTSIIFNRNYRIIQTPPTNLNKQVTGTIPVALTHEMLSFVDEIEKLFLQNRNYKTDLGGFKANTVNVINSALHSFFDHSFRFSDLLKYIVNQSRKTIFGDNIDCYDLEAGKLKANNLNLLIDSNELVSFQGYVAKVQGYSRDFENRALIGIKITIFSPKEITGNNDSKDSGSALSSKSVFELKLELKIDRGIDVEVKRLPRLNQVEEKELLNSYSDRALFLKVDSDLFKNMLANTALEIIASQAITDINLHSEKGIITAAAIYELKNHFSAAIQFLNSPNDWEVVEGDAKVTQLAKISDQKFAIRVNSTSTGSKLFVKLIPKNLESEISAFLAILELGVSEIRYASELCDPIGFDLHSQKYALASSVDFALAAKNRAVYIDRLLGVHHLKNRVTNGMTIIVEDHLEDGMERFVNKLIEIQKAYDLNSKNLSDELLQDQELRRLLKSEKFKVDWFHEAVRGFLGSFSISCRSELNNFNLKRSERRHINKFVIDWSKPEPLCHWIDPKYDQALGCSFELKSIISFDLQHSAGLPDAVIDRLVDLILPKIKSGSLKLPSLKLVTDGETQKQIYEWQSV